VVGAAVEGTTQYPHEASQRPARSQVEQKYGSQYPEYAMALHSYLINDFDERQGRFRRNPSVARSFAIVPSSIIHHGIVEVNATCCRAWRHGRLR
jgi:hypothetical protein